MDKDKLISIAKGAGIAAIGATLTYVTTTITGIDFGSYTPVVVAGWSILANTIRHYFNLP